MFDQKWIRSNGLQQPRPGQVAEGQGVAAPTVLFTKNINHFWAAPEAHSPYLPCNHYVYNIEMKAIIWRLQWKNFRAASAARKFSIEARKIIAIICIKSIGFNMY